MHDRTLDLFDGLALDPREDPAWAAHDPGGRSAYRLKPGIEGDAEFYDEGRRRLWLSRRRTQGSGMALWVGMNPSMAGRAVDDPTVAIEQTYTWNWGYALYVKTNAMDYRTTDQKGLTALGVVPCGPRNIETILDFARRADRVVLAYGAPHRSLDRYGRAVSDALFAAGIRPMCLALTAKGHPGHPQRRPSNLVPFPFPGYEAVNP